MNILTVENRVCRLDELPEIITDDLRYSILDNTNPKDPDYFFKPLVFMESFNSPAALMNIGKYEIKMPLDWNILVGVDDGPDLEILPLVSLNDRGFEAFVFNPINGYRPSFMGIDIINVYQDIKWFFPKLQPGHLLSVPLTNDPEPPCAYFIRDVPKNCDVVDLSLCW